MDVKVNIKISSLRYIITNIGGGWGYVHLLYGVTPDGKVYTTEIFNEDKLELNDELECTYLGQLDNIDLGLKKPHPTAIMDGTDLSVYEIDNTVRLLYHSAECSENNPSLYSKIKELERKMYEGRSKQLKPKDISEEVENKDMFISDFKYMFVNYGGNWVQSHDLYCVTSEGEVYITSKFDITKLDVKTKLNFDFIGKLPKLQLKLKRHPNYSVVDASEIHVYRVSNKLILLQKAPNTDENNCGMYKDILTLLYTKSISDYKKIKANKNIKLTPGEISTREAFAKSMKILNGGHPVHTTFHASTNSDLINQLRKEVLDSELSIDRKEHKLTKAEQKDLNSFISKMNTVLEGQNNTDYIKNNVNEQKITVEE